MMEVLLRVPVSMRDDVGSEVTPVEMPAGCGSGYCWRCG